MDINQMIRRLESLRDQYGNLSVYHEHDGVDYEPTVEMRDTFIEFDENCEAHEKPTTSHIIIH
jgi:hypothetical protein